MTAAFWGVTDGDSWLNGCPLRGRTRQPRRFDRNGQPEPAFDVVLKPMIQQVESSFAH